MGQAGAEPVDEVGQGEVAVDEVLVVLADVSARSPIRAA